MVDCAKFKETIINASAVIIYLESFAKRQSVNHNLLVKTADFARRMLMVHICALVLMVFRGKIVK